MEEITGATLETESAWLDQLASSERRAVSLAYLATKRQLPEIWAAREREGAGTAAAEARSRVEAGLNALQEKARAREFDTEALNRLSAAAVLQERPFTSDVPLLGPLIARFRSAWNNVASRWYVGHYVTQQNEFNRLAFQQIERYESELQEQIELLEEQVVLTSEMQRRIEELQADVIRVMAEGDDRELVEEVVDVIVAAVAKAAA